MTKNIEDCLVVGGCLCGCLVIMLAFAALLLACAWAIVH